MKTTKRILSLLLTMVMILGMIPVFASAAEATTASKVTSIAAGDQVVFVDESNTAALGAFSSKYYSAIKGVTVADGVVTLTSDIVTLTVEAGSAEGSFAFKDADGKYVGWSSGNSAYQSASIDANSSWTVTFDAKGVATLKNVKDATRILQYNPSSPRFAAYASSQKKIVIYKIDEAGSEGGDTPEVPDCEHPTTELRNVVAATCTTDGYTGDTYCTVCNVKLAEGSVTTATGHVDTNGDMFCDTCNTDLNTPTYVKVTSASDLVAGRKYIIVAAAADFAMSTLQNTNNRAQVAIVRNADGSITLEVGSTVQVLTLEAGAVEGTFAFNTGSGYLYAASTSSNYLKTKTQLDANGSWAIEVTSEGIATIKAQGTNTRNWLRYNATNNPPIFSCYGSGQTDVSIYMLLEEGACQHEELTYTYTATHHSATCASCGELRIENELHDTLGANGTCDACGYTIADMDALRVAYIEAAAALADKTYLASNITITGVITSVDDAWNTTYNNITVTIKYGDYSIKCFRLASGAADASVLAVGDTITVTGLLGNYGGAVQFGAACVLDAHTPHEHNYEWKATDDGLSHYQECSICLAKTEEATHVDADTNGTCDDCGEACGCAHEYVTTHPGDVHTETCSKCGTVKEAEYTFVWATKFDEAGHWTECTCGEGEDYKKASVAHEFNNGFCVCGASNALTDTMVSENLGIANGEVFPETTIGDGAIVITGSKGTGSNDVKYYETGKGIRVYGGGTLTIAPKAGYKIVKIVIAMTTDGASSAEAATFTNATGSVADGIIPEDGYQAVVLTNPATSGHYRIQSVQVYYLACEHAWGEGVVTTEPTTEATGVMTYTCGNCGATYTEEIPMVEVPEGPVVDETLVLRNDGALNLAAYIGAQFSVTTEIAEKYDTVYIVITHNGEEKTFELTKDSTGAIYFAEYGIAAKQMADAIDIALFATKDDVTYVGQVIEGWTIKAKLVGMLDQYYQWMSHGGAYKTTPELAAAMLAYGAAAQNQFSYNLDNLATNGVDAKYLALVPTEAPAMEAMPTFNNTGFKSSLYNPAFMLDDVIKASLTFAIGDAKIENYKARVTINGVTEDYELTQYVAGGQAYPGYAYIIIDSIVAADLRNDFTVTIMNGETAVSTTYTFSMENMAAKLMASRPDMITAIMNYADAAHARFRA